MLLTHVFLLSHIFVYSVVMVVKADLASTPLHFECCIVFGCVVVVVACKS